MWRGCLVETLDEHCARPRDRPRGAAAVPARRLSVGQPRRASSRALRSRCVVGARRDPARRRLRGSRDRGRPCRPARRPRAGALRRPEPRLGALPGHDAGPRTAPRGGLASRRALESRARTARDRRGARPHRPRRSHRHLGRNRLREATPGGLPPRARALREPGRGLDGRRQSDRRRRRRRGGRNPGCARPDATPRPPSGALPISTRPPRSSPAIRTG